MKQKKAELFSEFCLINIFTNYKELANLVSFDLLLAALFLWITFFLAKRSNIEVTFGNKAKASSLLTALRNFLTKVLVVFAWYLLRKRLAAFALILFNADL